MPWCGFVRFVAFRMSGRTEYGWCEDRTLAGSPRSSLGRSYGILSAPCVLVCDIVTVEVSRRPAGLPVGVRIGGLAVSTLLGSTIPSWLSPIPRYLFHTMGAGRVSAWFGEYYRVRILLKATCAASRADPAP